MVDHQGAASFMGHQTWYRVVGDLKAPKAPLVLLHGGPGAAHDYLEAFEDLAGTGRALVFYDQLGCGRSTHLPDRGPDFWTVDLFLDELDTLLDHLGIRDRYAVLGQSWGGMLGAEHAVRRPPGLRALVVADSPADMRTWVAEANRLRAGLPPDVQAVLLAHESAGTTDSPAYAEACRVFYDRHVCRVVPNPPGVQRSFAAIAADPTVYHTMNGPSEFHSIGTLRDWTIVDRLDQVAAPTLVISGRHDEATAACVRPFVDRIPGARWVLFEESSHMPHVEETEACLLTVSAFLDEADRAA